MKLSLGLGILLGLSAPHMAQAANALPLVFACKPLGGLKDNVESCEENGQYGDAGKACLNALQKSIQARAAAAKAAMSASHVAVVDKAGNAQHRNFQGANADYLITDDALAESIKNAKAAHAAVDGYLNNIIYPEDFDAPASLIGDMIAFLDKSPCYNDNRLGLEGVKKKIEKQIQELEQAKAASLARADVSAGRNTTQGSIQNNVIENGVASAAPRANGGPQGAARTPASSITGVKEDAVKRAQGAEKAK